MLFGNNFIEIRTMLEHLSALNRSRIEDSNFKARSQNFQKRLLAASYLSVCPHGTNRLPLDGFS